MNNIFIRGQRQITNLERKLNLHNGSIVVLKNRNKDDAVETIYYVVSFRDNKGKYGGANTTQYCTLLDLDTGKFAFEERCSRSTTVRRVLRHLLRCGYTMPYNPDATDDDYRLCEYDVDVYENGQYKMELVLTV